MSVGETSLDVLLTLAAPGADGQGQVEFAGWRSMELADAFQLGDEMWLVPLDHQGLFPLRFTLDGNSMDVFAPRARLEFTLTQTP
jgi:hypothetical protein